MSRGHKSGHNEPVEETLAIIAQQEVQNLLAILANSVQKQSASGTVVAAGDAITADASLVFVPSGSSSLRARVTATTTFSSGVGTVTPVLQTGTDGGALATEISGAQVTDGVGGFATSFEVDLPPGTVSLQVHWQTSIGDAAATLGAGIVGFGAKLLVEQVPRLA